MLRSEKIVLRLKFYLHVRDVGRRGGLGLLARLRLGGVDGVNDLVEGACFIVLVGEGEVDSGDDSQNSGHFQELDEILHTATGLRDNTPVLGLHHAPLDVPGLSPVPVTGDHLLGGLRHFEAVDGASGGWSQFPLPSSIQTVLAATAAETDGFFKHRGKR